MKRFLLPCIGFILYTCLSIASPPKHGWHAIEDLDQIRSDDSSPIGLQRVHRELGENEKELTLHLPDNSTERNVLLARFNLLVQNTDQSFRLISIPLEGQKDIVFDSSAITAFSEENYQMEIGEAQKAQSRLTTKDSSRAEEVGRASIKVHQSLRKYESFFTTVREKYTFFSQKLSIDEIVHFAREISSFPIMAVYPSFRELLDRRIGELTEADQSLQRKLRMGKEKLDKQYSEMSSFFDELDLKKDVVEASFREMQKILQEGIKHFVDFRELYAQKMSPVVGDFWHSEPKLIFMFRSGLLDSVKRPLSSTGERPVFLFLSLHSRFDICEICGPSLLSSLSPWGVLAERLSGHFGLQPSQFFLVSSFRQFRTKLWDQAKLREYREEAAQVPKTISLRELRTFLQGGAPYFFSAYIGDFSEISS